MPSTSTTSLKLDIEMKTRVQRLADAQRRTSHWIMREAIEEYVSRQEKRLSFLNDAQAAWEDYQRTGLHLTNEEVGDWLAKIEAGEDAELPECHV
jgi:predicted transcriptional regulator